MNIRDMLQRITTFLGLEANIFNLSEGSVENQSASYEARINCRRCNKNNEHGGEKNDCIFTLPISFVIHEVLVTTRSLWTRGTKYATFH